MASPQPTLAPSWCDRLTQDLAANDEAAKSLVAGLTDAQLNWQPSPGSWSIGQCVDHLCITNDMFVAAISAALQGKPRSAVDEIRPGWFGNWFIRSFVGPSPQTKRARAPKKVTPAARVDRTVLDRFLKSNESCRELFLRARDHESASGVLLFREFSQGWVPASGSSSATSAAICFRPSACKTHPTSRVSCCPKT